jgi:hypothetical protein
MRRLSRLIRVCCRRRARGKGQGARGREQGARSMEQGEMFRTEFTEISHGEHGDARGKEQGEMFRTEVTKMLVARSEKCIMNITR